MPITNYQSIRRAFDPQGYILQDELREAVEVAIALEQPLLLTGEPGTGKTRLAWKIADELSRQEGAGFRPEPLVFYTKTTSTARDLFYTYDAVGHFQTANIRREAGAATPGVADFIELQALGRAIALTDPGAVDAGKIAGELPPEPASSVVLIDEIDKAPRDFTNDILNEVEDYAFRIKEQDNYEIRRGAERQIVLVMTSNSEKNLPDAFLRRCVFYHIPFPGPDLLLQIARSQLGPATQYTEAALRELIATFNRIREQSVRKAPATAELIVWLRMLELKGYLEKDPIGQRRLLAQNLSVLVKTREDLDAIRQFLQSS